MPFPEASAALVEGLAAVAGLNLDSSALRHAADSSRRQVDQLIADNNEHRAMVRKLEENIDASEGNAMGVDEVPSGDEIAAELEKFLRARSSESNHEDGRGARRMKIDGGIGFDPTGIAEAARQAEANGYDGVWSAETSHDPFLPIAIGAGATEKLEFGTGIAVAFARNPMNLAVLANDLQLLTKGRFMLVWEARSSRTSPSASPCPGRTRRRGCASSSWPSGPFGPRGRPGRSSTSGASSTPTR